MSLHFYGLPIRPWKNLRGMAGRHFCCNHGIWLNGERRQIEMAESIGQSVMYDNGAYRAYTVGKPVDWGRYYQWLEPRLGHPRWAVIPDVIDGDLAQQWELIQQWPFSKALGAPVWHLHEEIGWLLFLVSDAGYERVCFGSSGAYWQVGSIAWERRVDEAFNALEREGMRPWVHMLRGMSVAGKRWPFASVDSSALSRNAGERGYDMAKRVALADAQQCPVRWTPRPEQLQLQGIEDNGMVDA